MKEVEKKRGWESRVKESEEEKNGVKERYPTTLETVGDQSERVEGPKAEKLKEDSLREISEASPVISTSVEIAERTPLEASTEFEKCR